MKQFIAYALALLPILAAGQEQDILKDAIALDEVLVKAIRVDQKAPFTQSYLNKTEIEERNLGQDVPALLNFLPSVVTTSDAGNGIGYTGIRVRGSDATRVNVTINGIPLNDSESHITFWVDLPDFASSTQSIQLQRGVGSSTNGAGAFGASLSLSTNGISEEAYARIDASAGSYRTYKTNVQFGTGILNSEGKWKAEVSGRVSALGSDGYIDRASSDLSAASCPTRWAACPGTGSTNRPFRPTGGTIPQERSTMMRDPWSGFTRTRWMITVRTITSCT